jgi:hypothetical protein
LLVETELFDKLKEESEKTSVSLTEYCRRKLRENCRFEVIERLLREVLEENGKE